MDEGIKDQSIVTVDEAFVMPTDVELRQQLPPLSSTAPPSQLAAFWKFEEGRCLYIITAGPYCSYIVLILQVW